jgi:Co/Zn/Cd efflux system component
MPGCAHNHVPVPAVDTGYRCPLVIVFFINAAMFAVEGSAGLVGNSVAL